MKWTEEVIEKQYLSFEDLYDSFPIILDITESGGYLASNVSERHAKIVENFVNNIYVAYRSSVVGVHWFISDQDFLRWKEDRAYQIAWWLVRSSDKYAEAIYQYQKMLDDSKLDKTTLTSTSKSSSSELPLNSEDYDNPTATSSGSTSTETRLPVDNYLQIKNMIEDIYSKWLYEFEQKFVYNVTNENMV